MNLTSLSAAVPTCLYFSYSFNLFGVHWNAAFCYNKQYSENNAAQILNIWSKFIQFSKQMNWK